MKVALIVIAVAGILALLVGLYRSRGGAGAGGRRTPGGHPGPPRDVAALVASLRLPAVLLRGTKESARSYFGGLPPEYAGFEWPFKGERPLAFLACIDLSEVKTIEWLPRTGLLLFFYDMEEQPWGFDPADRGGWAVRFVADPAAVNGEASAPETLTSEWRIRKRAMGFTPKALAPSFEHEAVLKLGLMDEESEALVELRGADYEGHPAHQIGGYPDPVQNADMEMECQLASNGVYLGDGTGHNDPRAKELAPGAADWRLLLQFDSDDDLGVMWGDGGMLYFWVRAQDAKIGDFSGVWLVMQCH